MLWYCVHSKHKQVFSKELLSDSFIFFKIRTWPGLPSWFSVRNEIRKETDPKGPWFLLMSGMKHELCFHHTWWQYEPILSNRRLKKRKKNHFQSFQITFQDFFFKLFKNILLLCRWGLLVRVFIISLMTSPLSWYK